VASEAARDALRDWRPDAPDGAEQLSQAIGEAVSVAICRYTQLEARQTALAMDVSCGRCESAASPQSAGSMR
jgi:hypothetical protein